MSRIAYVNGRYLPHGAATVHIEDRGYQFSDGVYEVIAVRNGVLIDGEWHMERLQRSLSELQIRMPMAAAALNVVLRETARRNRFREGIVYLQISRGVARRDHPFPSPDTPPALVVTARRTPPMSARVIAEGVGVISQPDIRWDRCDIKSISLLPNVLVKQAARVQGAFEAWQVDQDGFVTEGASTNAWIINSEGHLITRPVENAILNGITRRRLIALARAQDMTVEERPFTLAEAKSAREAFLTSTTAFVLPVVRIDETVLGNGRPGSHTMGLRQLYMNFLAEKTLETD
ncbi:MAG: D-amino-acid transaminase [Alphaproteobacteria bacterium]|nr:D-amino-acid transaminase [Alphaproteobacteria bacterium]MBL6951729.1 D-amino-acid transaminase [Alphaproteobacteria bacterium]